MSKTIHELTIQRVQELKKTIEPALRACHPLEEAAQTFTNLLFEEFEPSIVLLRFFATIPFGELPKVYQKHVNSLAKSENVETFLNDETPVLTLLGTRGGEEIRNIRQYFGIPLTSTDFVRTIPMVSQFLKDLGFDLDWDKTKRSTIRESDIETYSPSFLSGVFYVSDAQHAVNANGEKILNVVDRFQTYNLESTRDIETIFGIGGAYINGPFIAVILFSRETLEKSDVERLMPLASYFKTATLPLILKNAIFA